MGRGARKAVALLRSANDLLTSTGGLRFASTSGYFLATLRVVGIRFVNDLDLSL